MKKKNYTVRISNDEVTDFKCSVNALGPAHATDLAKKEFASKHGKHTIMRVSEMIEN